MKQLPARAPVSTRRQMLTRVAPGLVLALLLPACGRPDAPTSSPALRPQAASPGTPATPVTATPASGTPVGSPVAATPVVPTPTLWTAQPSLLGRGPCPGFGSSSSAEPSAPYNRSTAFDQDASPFAEKVRRFAQLILIGTVRDILPARWTTPDGQRPVNPHSGQVATIYTPIRVQIEQLAKGTYALPDLYFAEFGGRVGQDCESYSGSRAEFRFGQRYLYLVNSYAITQPPVPGDDRYGFHRALASYAINPDGTLTIGPEHDAGGRIFDNPPRTLTVDEVLREIAELLAAPSATPTR
ncbi:MAG: hypothetical protein U0841_28110 [Chloroflexia bacterium]